MSEVRFINKDRFDEEEQGVYSFCARDAGIEEQEFLEMNSFKTNLGNGLPFEHIDGDDMEAHYRQPKGTILIKVYNC